MKKKILDVSAVSGKRINLKNYTHILSYHACRSENECILRTQGLKPYTQDEALAVAIQKLESTRITKDKIANEFYRLWEQSDSKQLAKVWLMLQTKEFLSKSPHYLIYGSEFINTLAMHLGCRDRLKQIGKPTIVVCTVPIVEISPVWLNDLETDVKSKCSENRSIAVSKVAAENVIDIFYPTGFVCDPYSNLQYELG